jgi:restriction endonuclease S subunit
MIAKLTNIVNFQSGIYEKPEPDADTLYLQAVHFDGVGNFNETVFPQLKLNNKIERHLLKDNDLLFAAKGLNNFAIVYHTVIGKAVASSSFIILRLTEKSRRFISPEYLAWFISHDKKIKLIHGQQLGTTIPSINMKQLAELEIDIPSMEIQHKIVKVQRLREHEQKLVEELERYKDKKIQLLLSKAKNI